MEKPEPECKTCKDTGIFLHDEFCPCKKGAEAFREESARMRERVHAHNLALAAQRKTCP